VPALEDDGDVDVEDVALDQLALAGDAVADDMVDRGADRARKAAIIERRRDGAMIDIAAPLEFIGDEATEASGVDRR